MAIYIDIVGFVAGVLTTLSIVPEILKTAKMKETRDLSIDWIGMLVGGTFLWTVYGLLIDSLPIMAANFISFVLGLVLLFLKLKYR